MQWLLLILLGLVAGALSGLIGIGGGVIITTALVMIFGYSQKLAQGTTLALLVPPVGIVAAYTYYKQGYVNIHAAVFIIIGFVIGSILTARFATNLSNTVITRVFAIFIIVIAINMLVRPKT